VTTLFEIADAIAEQAHDGQKRKGNGRPYIEHPRAVAEKLRSRGHTEPAMLEAALLHDVVEDCGIGLGTLCQMLVERGAAHLDAAMVCELVWQLTSLDKMFGVLTKLHRSARKEIQCTRLRYVSRLAVIIKVYDRCHNLGDMGDHEPDFKKKYLAESVALFAEASDVLGVGAWDADMQHALNAAIV
jgi:(p)ppGpp synthase/HD superfamily hydrolase